jgi:glycosyltransferase involved in cell wall biosynthesis
MRQRNKNLPKVSIIVTTYNEEKDIENLLKSFMKLKYPKNKLEIIVVDDGSTDKTVEIIQRYSVKLIKTKHRGFGEARNIGLKVSRGDIVAFIDADMVLHPTYTKEIIKFFGNRKIAGVDNKELLYSDKSLISRLLYLKKVPGWAESNLVIPRVFRRSILEKLGGFDPDYGYYIDQEMRQRILKSGYQIGKIPKAIEWHKEISSWKELYSQCVWNGRSMVSSFKSYKKEALRRVAFVSLCAGLPLYILLLVLPPFQLLGVLGICLFLFIGLKRSLKMYLITKQKVSFLTPFFDFISMSFVVVGILDKLLNIGKKPAKGKIN